MATPAQPDLDPYDVLGSYQPGYSPDYFNFGGPDPNSPGQYSYTPFEGVSDEAFAPPMPQVLPEIQITAPRVAPPPAAPPLIGPLVNIVTRVLTPIVGLLTPLTPGPRSLDEAPTPAVPSPSDPVLDPITITAPPPKPPTRTPPIALDPIMPPNWGDLAQPTWLTPYQVPNPPGLLPRLIDFATRTSRWWDDALELFDVLKPTGDIGVDTRPRRRTGDPSPLRMPGVGRPDAYPLWTQPLWTPVPDLAPDLLPQTSPVVPRPGPAPVQPRPGIETRPRVEPAPSPRVAPRPVTQPFPGPYGSPVYNPLPFNPTAPAPRVATPRAPAPTVRPPPLVNPIAPWLTPVLDTTLTPELRLAPGPAPKASPCVCPPSTREKPKDEKRKSKPRVQCRQGTYTQRAKGIIYTPRRIVPCR